MPVGRIRLKEEVMKDPDIVSVAEIATEVFGSEKAGECIQEDVARSAIVSKLVAARVQKGYSIRALARKMGVSPAKLCRLEDKQDDELSIGDIRDYANAVSLDFTTIVEQRKSSEAQMREDVSKVYALLENLSVYGERKWPEGGIRSKIKRFCGEVLMDFLVGDTVVCAV